MKPAWCPDGPHGMKITRVSSGYRLQYEGLADYLIDDISGMITIGLVPNASLDQALSFLLNQALPRLMAHQGAIFLHAGAVVVSRHGIGLMGASGTGKSTLVASFADAGHRILGDDGLMLEMQGNRVVAVPVHDGLRLWPDVANRIFGTCAPEMSADQKLQIASPGPRQRVKSARLGSLFVLSIGESEDICIERLPAHLGCIEILRHCFALDPTDREVSERKLDAVASISKTIPVSSIRFPRKFQDLANLRASIIDHQAGQGVADQ